MRRRGFLDPEGNLNIYQGNKLKEYRNHVGTRFLYDGNENQEHLTKIIYPNGEIKLYQGSKGNERMFKMFKICPIAISLENKFHTYSFWGEPGKETFYKIELCFGGEIYYNSKGVVSSFNFTPEQLNYFLQEINYLENSLHNMSYYLNKYSNPPYPISMVEESKPEAMKKTISEKDFGPKEHPPKKAKIVGSIEVEIYPDCDTIVID